MELEQRRAAVGLLLDVVGLPSTRSQSRGFLWSASRLEDAWRVKRCGALDGSQSITNHLRRGRGPFERGLQNSRICVRGIREQLFQPLFGSGISLIGGLAIPL